MSVLLALLLAASLPAAEETRPRLFAPAWRDIGAQRPQDVARKFTIICGHLAPCPFHAGNPESSSRGDKETRRGRRLRLLEFSTPCLLVSSLFHSLAAGPPREVAGTGVWVRPFSGGLVVVNPQPGDAGPLSPAGAGLTYRVWGEDRTVTSPFVVKAGAGPLLTPR